MNIEYDAAPSGTGTGFECVFNLSSFPSPGQLELSHTLADACREEAGRPSPPSGLRLAFDHPGPPLDLSTLFGDSASPGTPLRARGHRVAATIWPSSEEAAAGCGGEEARRWEPPLCSLISSTPHPQGLSGVSEAPA